MVTLKFVTDRIGVDYTAKVSDLTFDVVGGQEGWRVQVNYPVGNPDTLPGPFNTLDEVKGAVAQFAAEHGGIYVQPLRKASPLEIAQAVQEVLNGLGEVWEDVTIAGVRSTDTHMLKNALNLMEGAAEEVEWVQGDLPSTEEIVWNTRGRRMFIWVPRE